MFGTVLVFELILFLFTMSIPLVLYVINAIGLSRMARSCNLKSPWLAWVPIGDLYLVGSMAEIGASRGGKKSLPYRKILPILSAGVIALFIAVIVLFVGMILDNPEVFQSEFADDTVNVELVDYDLYDPDSESPTDDFGWEMEEDPDLYADDIEEIYTDFLLTFVGIFLFYLAILGIAIVLAVFEYIALWHVFKLFDEPNAVIYLVLGIFVSSALPILYLILSRKTPNLPTAQPTYTTYLNTPTYNP